MEIDHEAIGKIVTQFGLGKGVPNNPLAAQCKEWERRKANAEMRALLTEKIVSLYEPRFITPPETCELIEAIVTTSDARRVLELGTYTGFCVYHILRAIIGKEGISLVTVDVNPAHDVEFFGKFPFLRQIKGKTPGALDQLVGETFDLVFVDSDHSMAHTESEFDVLLKLVPPGGIFLFHDVPEWVSASEHFACAPRVWLNNKVKAGVLRGTCFPTCEQADLRVMLGEGYPKQCNPGLGVFVLV